MAKPSQALEANLRLVNHQITIIDQEIEQRKVLSTKILDKLNRQLNLYLEVKNDKIKLADFSPNRGFSEDQEHVRQLIRETQHHIRVEEQTCWVDLKKLNEEKRQLMKEKAQLEFNLQVMQHQTR